MKIALIGAIGNVGRRIVDEALHRSHQVTAIAREPHKLNPQDGLTRIQGDANAPSKLAPMLAGHDIVVI